MVNILTIVAICITLFIGLVLPIALYIVYGVRNKKKEVWIAGAFGACGFVLLQVAIRLQIINVFAALPGFITWVKTYYILYCFILAFTAGAFEVIGRYGVAKILSKSESLSKNLTYEMGIAAGIGHGGIEAVVLIGTAYVNNLIYVILINTGLFDSMLDKLMGTEKEAFYTMYQQFQAVRDILIETPWQTFLLAGYERILTMVIHIALTLLVFYFVSQRKDIAGILICLFLHTAVDFFIPILNGMASEYLGYRITQNTAYILVYTTLTIAAAGGVLIVLRIKKLWKAEA